MSYRLYLLFSSGLGVVPAFTFVVLYAFFDRPKHRDRYAFLLLGLGIVAFLGFAVPFTLALIGEPPVPPTTVWRWLVSVGIRGLAATFMWWLLWVYLTPGRARIRLGRFGPMLQGGED